MEKRSSSSLSQRRRLLSESELTPELRRADVNRKGPNFFTRARARSEERRSSSDPIKRSIYCIFKRPLFSSCRWSKKSSYTGISSFRESTSKWRWWWKIFSRKAAAQGTVYFLPKNKSIFSFRFFKIQIIVLGLKIIVNFRWVIILEMLQCDTPLGGKRTTKKVWCMAIDPPHLYSSFCKFKLQNHSVNFFCWNAIWMDF